VSDPSFGRLGFPLLVAVVVLGAAESACAEAPAAAPEHPRLVVFVSVDQMHSEYLSRFGSLFQGGLKRVNEEGAVFPNAYYRHANSETGPGHALLLSGRHARDNGIVANEWFDRLEGKTVNVVDDPAATAVPGPGRGASPAHFIGVTLGDLLKKASPASRVVGVAMKDRAAILMTGPRADAAFWYAHESKGFGTSTYYMRALPPWLAAWNAAGHIDALAGKMWTRLLSDEALYRRFAGPDDVKGEWDNVDSVFPHRIRGAPGSAEFYEEEVRRAPFIDELTLDVALQAMKAYELGKDESTDILAVGMSATDVIGHTYGPDSQEIMDQILRLDRLLGRLFDAAEAQAGRGRVLFGLSADHSSMPLVELLKAKGLDARRVAPADIETAVRQALQKRFPGAGDLIEALDVPNVYLDQAAIARHGLSLPAVQDVVKEVLLKTGVVERVYTPAEILGDPPRNDPDFALVRNSFFESRSPQVIGVVKPYVYVSDHVGGTGHGTVHDYDRHVPLAFFGSGIKPGRYDVSCGPEDIAPTLAARLGVAYKVEDGQRVLSEALARGADTREARTGGER
jgi:hypothetical protein